MAHQEINHVGQTLLGSPQLPRLTGLAFEKGLCAQCPFVQWQGFYLREGTGVWAGQEYSSWRAGQGNRTMGKGSYPSLPPTTHTTSD